jgi:hypothetical protein
MQPLAAGSIQRQFLNGLKRSLRLLRSLSLGIGLEAWTTVHFQRPGESKIFEQAHDGVKIRGTPNSWLNWQSFGVYAHSDGIVDLSTILKAFTDAGVIISIQDRQSHASKKGCFAGESPASAVGDAGDRQWRSNRDFLMARRAEGVVGGW